MSENLSHQSLAVERVFGSAFSLTHGPASQEVQQQYLEERLGQMNAGIQTWIARSFDVNQPLLADLYTTDKEIAATLILDCELGLTKVYVTNGGSKYVQLPYCENVPFEEAVRDASLYAASLKQW